MKIFENNFKEFEESDNLLKKSSLFKLYLFEALFIGIISPFASGSLDISIGDTYVVVSNYQLIIAFGLLTFVFGIWLKKLHKKGKILAPFWIIAHQTLSFALILGTVYLFHSLSKIKPSRLYFDSIEYKELININYWLAATIALFLFVQFLFVLVLLIMGRK